MYKAYMTHWLSDNKDTELTYPGRGIYLFRALPYHYAIAAQRVKTSTITYMTSISITWRQQYLNQPETKEHGHYMDHLL